MLTSNSLHNLQWDSESDKYELKSARTPATLVMEGPQEILQRWLPYAEAR